MKRISLLIWLMALASAGTSVAQDGNPAIERFKEGIRKADAWMKEQEKVTEKNPLLGLVLSRTMVVKLREVPTEGLPADLKGAYDAYVTATAQMAEIFAGWPETEKELTEYLQKRVAEDPQVMDKVSEKMDAWGKVSEPVRAQLQEVAKKYGLQSIVELF